MRLTLRTLLAFLDDVLEPADAEVLGSKIEESEFASGLVHRIRSATRKIRLSAPKLEGRGVGLDANTVAEYLDSTLSSERVPDFERICLESDVHLAEAAACHQILTLVLGEPAEVPFATRDRVYALSSMNRVEAPATSDEPVTPVPDDEEYIDRAPVQKPRPAESAEKRVSRKKRLQDEKVGLPDLPEYMAASARRRFVPYIVTAVLVFLIASVAFVAIGPSSIVALFQGETAQDAPADGVAPDEPKMPDSVSPATTNSGNPIALPANSTDGNASTVDSTTTGSSTDTGSDTTTAGTGRPPMKENVSSDPPMPPMPATPGSKPPATTDGTDMPPAAPEPKPIGSDPKPPTVAGTGTDKGDDSAKPADEKIDIGRYTSEKQILSRLDETKEDWFRMPTGASLSSGDQLLVFPTYRPQMFLSAGIQVTVAGASRIDLGGLDEKGSPLLSVEFGRLTFFTVGRPGTSVRLNLGGRKGIATLKDADANFAVEVSNYLPPGINPEADESEKKLRHTIVQISTIRGQIEWTTDGETKTIDEGGIHVLVDDLPGATTHEAELPLWITSSEVMDTEDYASKGLEPMVDLKRPIVVSLFERTMDEHVEVRSLASRSLSYLDRHDAFLTILGNPDNRSYWESSINTVRAALARSKESSVEVRGALEAGGKGELYRMLWGYSPTQLLAENADDQLVSYLSHDSLEVRVLAITNLVRITEKSFFYRPEATERSRRMKLPKWREMLESGLVDYVKPSTLPLPKGITLRPASAAPATTPPGDAGLPKATP